MSGFFSVLARAALDGEWPHYGALGWLIFAGGLTVLALLLIAFDARFLDKGRVP